MRFAVADTQEKAVRLFKKDAARGSEDDVILKPVTDTENWVAVGSINQRRFYV